MLPPFAASLATPQARIQSSASSTAILVDRLVEQKLDPRSDASSGPTPRSSLPGSTSLPDCRPHLHQSGGTELHRVRSDRSGIAAIRRARDSMGSPRVRSSRSRRSLDRPMRSPPSSTQSLPHAHVRPGSTSSRQFTHSSSQTSSLSAIAPRGESAPRWRRACTRCACRSR